MCLPLILMPSASFKGKSVVAGKKFLDRLITESLSGTETS